MASGGGTSEMLPPGSLSLGGAEMSSGKGQCQGLECAVPTCPAGSTTSISGKVYDPAGKTPLYNVAVYVPNGAVSPLTEGASCDRCGANIVNPVSAAITDETGAFKLTQVPAGTDVPIVIQVGKWRRQIKVPTVTACTDTALTDPQITRLPRNKSEGEIRVSRLPLAPRTKWSACRAVWALTIASSRAPAGTGAFTYTRVITAGQAAGVAVSA